MTEQTWDERYSTAQRVWSGEPNAWLVRIAESLPAGSALDLGCGEGADAIWLARRGWDVTGVDFSRAALRRAEHEADAAGVTVAWRRADLSTWRPGRAFDLVSVQYFHGDPEVRRRVHRTAWEATAGTLVVAGHDLTHPGGPPPEVRYDVAEVLASLDLTPADPRVVLAEQRSRGEARDVVVVLRR